MLLLYYSPGACSLAAHIVLEEIGKPFETRKVSVREGETARPEYLAINPHGRVPALIQGDWVLTESPAILAFLGERHPEARLIDRSDFRVYGRTLELLNFFSSSVHIAFAQVWRAQRFAESEATRAEVVEAGRSAIGRYFDEIEAEVSAAGDWLVGNRFSIADPYLLVFWRWGDLIGLDMGRYHAWRGHKERMLARPAVQRALGRVDKRDSQLSRLLIQDCFLRSSHGSRRLVGCGVGADRAVAAA